MTERNSPAPTRWRPSNRTFATVRISPNRSSWASAGRAPPTLAAASTRHTFIIPRTPLGRFRGHLALLGSLVERTLPLQPAQRVIRQDENEQRTDHRQPDLLESDVGPVRDRLTAQRLEKRQRDVAAVQD